MNRIIVLALLMLVPSSAFAVGETYGRIRGTVTEKDTGLALAGATITAVGKNLIGGPRSVTSGDTGSYQIPDLPPGPYEIEVEYSQMKAQKRRVTVRLGEAVPLDLVWSPDVFEADVIDVVQESHLTRPDSTQTGTVLSFDTEKRLATGRSQTDVAQQVAGVKNQGGLPSIKGGTRIQNKYLVDGMDITDSVTNNFATQLNFDSISSMEVITGAMEAQYNAMGGVINVNTNGGSDEFKLDTSFYLNNQAFTARNTYGTGAFDQDLLNPANTVNPSQGYNITANISGPIMKQKLWYGLSFEYGLVQTSIQPGPPLNVAMPPRVQHQFRPRLKFTIAPTNKLRITWTTSGDPALDTNRNQSNGGLPITEQSQTQGGAFSVVQLDYIATENVVFNLQAGFNYNHVHQSPACAFMGGAYLGQVERDPRFSEKAYTCNPDEPSHFNSVESSSWYNGPRDSNSQRYTVQFDPSISVHSEKAGSHDFKFGIQSRYVLSNFAAHTPGGMTYSDRPANGLQYEAALCNPETGENCNLRTISPDFQSSSSGFGIGVYAQDRWRIHKRFTLLPGVRLDYGRTQNTIGELTTNSVGVGPRLGFTADLTGDNKTILSAFYGRSNETLMLLVPNYADPSSTSETQRWDNNTKQWVVRNTSGGPGSYVLNPNSTTPHTDEITATLNREIVQDAVLSLSYTWKKTQNIWSEVEINQIWDPTGQRVIGYANGVATPVQSYQTPDSAYRLYNGLDLVAEARPIKDLDIYLGYTLSFLYGTGNEQVRTGVTGNPYSNPRQTPFYEGYLPEDSRHQLKMRVSYAWHGLSAGINLTYSTGTPLQRNYFNQFSNGYGNRRSPSGSQPGSTPNDPSTWASFRLPDTLISTLRVSYDIHEISGQHLIFIADIFNLFNLGTITGVNTSDNALFGLSNGSRISPLRLQLAIRYMY